MKWMNKIRYPSLNWLSRFQIKGVRDSIIGLYLNAGEGIRLAPPKKPQYFGITELIMFGGTTHPCFTWNRDKHQYNAWLKVLPDKAPCWDLQVDDKEPVRVRFKTKETLVVADVVKGFSSYFPFLPTENHFINGGKFVA